MSTTPCRVLCTYYHVVDWFERDRAHGARLPHSVNHRRLARRLDELHVRRVRSITAAMAQGYEPLEGYAFTYKRGHALWAIRPAEDGHGYVVLRVRDEPAPGIEPRVAYDRRQLPPVGSYVEVYHEFQPSLGGDVGPPLRRGTQWKVSDELDDYRQLSRGDRTVWVEAHELVRNTLQTKHPAPSRPDLVSDLGDFGHVPFHPDDLHEVSPEPLPDDDVSSTKLRVPRTQPARPTSPGGTVDLDDPLPATYDLPKTRIERPR